MSDNCVSCGEPKDGSAGEGCASIRTHREVAIIAALYVESGGSYYGLDGVDPWDETRDARQYAGPWPAVAHPPCQRWGIC